ncbi:hypothetical protein [Arthrobacter glacialis]|uniref:Uncharacterized protein n=1 Tax=Arthrobacter glacialis TaxID=1664 RepID=A0A2S3ZWA0_ARTGL|nr:hypothetical protein [Arthrobacter glacialis]POH58989.1 hypothetical protein CVS28_09810 [Arthrobacter glacialis]POH73541.1 hypothetical protein CVS27_09170 [Arthrobacter glacialis]
MARRATTQWARPEGVLAGTTDIFARSDLDFISACVTSADPGLHFHGPISKDGTLEAATPFQATLTSSGTGALVTVHLGQRLN